MNNLQIYKKPLLAVLEQEKKIREYNAEERLMLSKNIIQTLLIDLGVGKNSDPEQHVRAIKYLSEDCGKYSFEEIQEAFKLAIVGKLHFGKSKIDLFQQVNVLIVGKVLTAFDDYKNEKLKIYRLAEKQKREALPMMNKEEIKKFTKQAVEKQIEYFLKYRVVDKSRVHVYDIFDKIGLMPTDLNYKNSVKKDAIDILKQEYSQKKASNKDEFNQIKNTLKSLENGRCDEIKTKCKELALEEFLRKITKNKTELENLKLHF